MHVCCTVWVLFLCVCVCVFGTCTAARVVLAMLMLVVGVARQVPEFKPPQAFEMFRRFLNKQSF